MYTLKQARIYAANLALLHNEPWDVIRTHPLAKINSKPANLFNTGNYVACAHKELVEYVAGGCEFVETIFPVKSSRQRSA